MAAVAELGDVGLDVVRNSLRTDVVDIFRREISTLHPLPREAAYETILNQPSILEECFKLFRSRPQLFSQVAVGPDAQPISSDNQLLRCGRSLADIIALVVRAAAKRYFRTRLKVPGVSRKNHIEEDKALSRFALALGLARPPRQGVAPPPISPADKLYRAIRDYLQFEWQVQLIPHYAPLSPERVRQLGPLLLGVREPAELHALGGLTEDRGSQLPLLLDTARRLLVKGGEAIDSDVLWLVCQQMDLGRLFPTRDPIQMRRAVVQVAATQPAALSLLMPVLGDDLRRFTVFLMVAYTNLGEQRFRQVFGPGGQTMVVRQWAERLAKQELPPPQLTTMKATFERLFSASAALPSARDVDIDRANAEILAALERLPSRALKPKIPGQT